MTFLPRHEVEDDQREFACFSLSLLSSSYLAFLEDVIPAIHCRVEESRSDFSLSVRTYTAPQDIRGRNLRTRIEALTRKRTEMQRNLRRKSFLRGLERNRVA